uniref:Putative exonuclease n=1 Tax=viral metagenome TaxID=1070528 RepID=A0A6M3JJX8_9ZZZZ
MIIIDCVQLSDEWFSEKAGVPSAGSFDKIVTTKGEPSKSAKGYMYQLAAEAITGKCEQGYQSGPMSVGIEREEESRALYELIYGVEVQQVGFIYPDEQKKWGCSPDGIINGEYGLEMKNVLPKTQIKYLLDEKLPTEYIQQVQGSLLVTGFDRWDFFSYSPGLDPFILQVERDEKFIEKLRAELDKFCLELSEIIKKLKY